MKVRTPDQIEKRRVTFGTITITLTVLLSTAIVTVLGMVQMA